MTAIIMGGKSVGNMGVVLRPTEVSRDLNRSVWIVVTRIILDATNVGAAEAVAAVHIGRFHQFHQRHQAECETVTGIIRGELTTNNAANTTEVCTVIETNCKATTATT